MASANGTASRASVPVVPDARRAPRTIALCGSAPSTRDLAPTDDPAVEVWALVVARKYVRRADRWFELHDAADIAFEGEDFHRFLQSVREPLYMWEARPEYPASVAFPLDAVLEGARPYATSSAAYMVALAIHELRPVVEGDEIRLYGLDMAPASGYEHQQDSMSYWLGRAEGLGIRVWLPQACPLLKAPLYGRPDPNAEYRDMLAVELKQRLTKLAEEKAALAARANGAQGALSLLEQLRPHLDEALYERTHAALSKQRRELGASFNGVLGQLKEVEYLRSLSGALEPAKA